MRTSILLALPASLLLYIADARESEQPRHLDTRNVPYHDRLIRKDLEAQRKLAWQTPVGVRKMGEDEGEKFFLHYWSFEEEPDTAFNSTVAAAPIAPHTAHDRKLSLLGHRLFSRDYQCPANTISCSHIGSDLCCPSGETCVSTSSGVGCCAAGDDCDTVATCDTAAGYTSCPNSSVGGCCVPGSVCEGDSGCVVYGTSTVVLTLAPSTVTAGMTTVTGQSGTTTYIVPQSTISGYTTTVTVTKIISGQVSTVTQRATVVIIGSLPGISSTETSFAPGTASAPIRPTSVSSSDLSVVLASVTTTITVSSTTSDVSCPTGYYMCSAYYMGNCCRVGRNCDTTSCPSVDSTTIVSGPTVVVPATTVTTTGSNAAVTQGSCANGWDLCDASSGGGCCPSGYVCGASCTATDAGNSNTAKEAPSSASLAGVTWTFMVLAMMAGVGMTML